MGNFISDSFENEIETEKYEHHDETINHEEDKEDDQHFEDVESYIEYMYSEYPEKHYYNFPEFAVNKLDLETSYLEDLPEVSERTRENIRDWMINSKISLKDFIWVGW